MVILVDIFVTIYVMQRSTACEMARLYIPTQRDAEKENNFDYYCGAYFNEIAGNIVNGLVNSKYTAE